MNPNGTPGHCRRCEEEVEANASFCSCGTPTATATFAERNEYEAKQWRAYLGGAE